MSIQELEEWFTGRELPAGRIQISKSTTIEDLRKSVDAEFHVLRHNDSPKMREPRIGNLLQIKEWLEANGI